MYILASGFMDKVQEFLNSLGQKLVDFAFGWLEKVPPMIQAIILISLAILAVIGLIALIKWSFKVIIPLAILAILAILIWVFIL